MPNLSLKVFCSHNKKKAHHNEEHGLQAIRFGIQFLLRLR